MTYIPGPQESKEAFQKRTASHTLYPPLSVFDLQLTSVPVHFSNRKLAPWEGGCAWIQDGQVVLQLRKALQKKESYLGLVSKKELLEHEAVHALRVAFDEPRFEEVLAYQTSASRFRRYFGPFFRTPRESLLFLSTMLLFPLTLPFPHLQLPFAVLLSLITGYGLLRLVVTQRIFKKAKRNLEKVTENPLALLTHLTDQEIAFFAKGANILEYAKRQSCMRWAQISSVFFSGQYSQY